LTATATLACLILGPAAVVSCRGGGASTDKGQAGATSASAAASSSPTADTPAFLLPAASVSAFQNPMGLPAYSGPTGSVEGVITVDGDPAPDVDGNFTKCPAAKEMYGKLFREGPPLPSGARPLADAMVGVTGYSGFYIPSSSHVRKVTIENCGFTERTIDMTIGEHIEVFNKTKDLYAPALAQVQTPAIMLAPPGGDPVKLYPVKPAYYTLLDRANTAPYMVANVYVVAFPLHTTSGLDGHYRIDGVPVGRVTVSARQGAIQRTASKNIDVLENVVARVDLSMTYRKPNAGIPTPVVQDAGTNINY
jgi:hypothetical protein